MTKICLAECSDVDFGALKMPADLDQRINMEKILTLVLLNLDICVAFANDADPLIQVSWLLQNHRSQCHTAMDCPVKVWLASSRWLSWMRRPTGDQEVAGLAAAEVGNILSWRLIMKYFLWSFSPFR